MIALVVLVAALGASAEQFQADAKFRAQAWMHSHANPDEAGMNDLKASDPGAFAIVQALLAKQSMGLLDANHPSASFAPHHSSAADILRNSPAINGAATDAAAEPEAVPMAADPVPVAAVAYPEPVHHQTSGQNWMNWKPSNNDDALVSNVLGAVSELKGASPSGSLLSQGQERTQSVLAADSSMLAAELPVRAPAPRQDSLAMPAMSWTEPAQAQAPPAPRAAMNQELRSVKTNIQWNSDAAAMIAEVPKPRMAANQENAFLKSINFNTAMQPVLASANTQQDSESSPNKLTSFNFDTAPTEEEVHMVKRAQTAYMQQLDDKVRGPMSAGSLGSWLSAPPRRTAE